jgi:hypothetical protein
MLRRSKNKEAQRRKYQGLRELAVDIALERDQHCKGLDLIPGHQCRGQLVGHEPLKRSAGGDPCDPEQVMTICEQLNMDVENYPDLAKVFGLTISASSKYENGRLKRDWK